MSITRVGMLALTAIAVTLSSVTPARSQEDWVPGKYMIEAIGEMLDAADLLNRKIGYGYAEGACMAGVLLKPKTSYAMNRRFEKGVPYAIVAGGDSDATDIDIEIVDAQGNIVIKDDREDRMGVIEWTPEVTGDYNIRVKLFDAKLESFCAFAVLRRDGFQIPLKDAIDAAGKFFGDCRQIVAAADKNNSNVGFLSTEGQAGLWGTVLPKGESLTLSGVVPGGGTGVVLGRGNHDEIDIDLHVLQGGNEVGRDIEEDSFPRYVADFKEGSEYQVKLSNVDGEDGISFVIGGVLRVYAR